MVATVGRTTKGSYMPFIQWALTSQNAWDSLHNPCFEPAPCIDNELVTDSTPSEPPTLRGANLDLEQHPGCTCCCQSLGLGKGAGFVEFAHGAAQLSSQLTLWKRQAALECDGLVRHQ